MSGIREFLNSGAGKVVSALVCVAAIGLAAFLIYTNLGSNPAVAANQRVFMDVATGQTFGHELTIGEEIPITAPSGQKTGYPTEACNWTKDGKPGEKIAYVVLNEMVGKTGPTFCPDCDRLVVGNNAPAVEGKRAPPTRAEMSGSGRP